MATDDKYDRQLRLWGAHGQKALMEAHICMLGASACGTEALKNLVLPGIGHFTVIDSASVAHADLGQNFFLEEGDVGKPRAEAVCRWLQELNPDVRGSHIAKDPAQAISEGVDFFRKFQFSLVVGSQLSEAASVQLWGICHKLGLPLLLVTSVGFIGRIRLYAEEHCVCETKPDSEFGDLRLNDPFPELRAFATNIDIDSLDLARHAHVPYVVILIQALDRFREREKKPLPTTQDDKKKFKDIIAKMQRNDQEGNFAEALDNAYKAWIPYSIPEPVRSILDHCSTTRDTSDFWIVARAVSAFVRDCGKLPLAGTMPDMTASTDMFIKLQEIYNSRADGDCAAINAHVAMIQKELGVTTAIAPEYIKRFCQNAQHCEVFRFRTLEEELQPTEENGADLASEYADEDSLVQWYLALRAMDRFRDVHGHYPGQLCEDTEQAMAGDVQLLVQVAAGVVDSYKTEGVAVDSKMIEEVVRYGGCELHLTSSVLGGIASQEAVKLITKQYSPLNNTLIYNGLHGKMQTIEV
mmetsp:Transcript_96365/g.272862  ORF Transcript_96365/g.272862 Transcript_96365/m.272862 type:complete len:524 (+) Transcript_96365:183-1754(+)